MIFLQFPIIEWCRQICI